MVRALGSLFTIYALTVSISGHPARASREDVIGQARAAYYNLKTQGFNGFEAALEPKWEVILGPTATSENLKVFRAMRFAISVDPTGAATVSHVVLGAKTTRVDPYIKQIHYNIQRLVSAVMGTWARFMVNSPFPVASQIKVERLAKGYNLFYTIESTDVMLTVADDWLITEWKLTDSKAKRTIKPFFQKTIDGFLLTGYHSVFEPRGEGNKTSWDISIDYQIVSNMRIPRKIQFKGTHGSEPVEAELTLHSVRTALRS